MNYWEINNKFNEKLEFYRVNRVEIKSQKGNGTCLITNEKFKQIYVPADSNELNASARCEIDPCYFYEEENGTLLKLDKKGDIYLIENRCKKSPRKLYRFKLHRSGGYKNLRDYQLSALIFGSDITEKAKLLLDEKGINSFDKSKGIASHHKNKNNKCNSKEVLLAIIPEHQVVHKDVPSDDIKLLDHLLDVSKIFDGNKKNTVIIPCEKKEKLRSDIISVDGTELETFVRNEILENMKIEPVKLIVLNDEIVKVITTETGKKCLLDLDNKIKSDLLPDTVSELFKEG